MKKILNIVFFLLINVTLYTQDSSQNFTYILDSANLLSAEQQLVYENKAQQIATSQEVGVYFITVPQVTYNIEEWMVEFYQKRSLFDDTVIFFINMDPSQRWMEIRSYGKIQEKVTTDRITELRAWITPLLTEQQYNRGVNTYYSQVYTYIIGEVPFDIKKLLIQLAVAMLVGFIFTYNLVKNAGGVMTVSHSTYNKRSRLLERYDRYLYSIHTKRRLESSSSSGRSSSSSGGGNSF